MANCVEDDLDDGSAQDIARSAFADMLQDTERNELYEKGIIWAISELRSRGVSQIVVLDIGTGSGLLSMLAARHGADVIYACDGFPPAVIAASKVIASNGYSDRIKLISKMSTDLKVGAGLDLETRANLLVAELFDTELIGEGLIRSYSDARARLLTEDCLMFVDSPFLRRHHSVPRFGLHVTEDIEACAGTASLHDIQLSQLNDEDFTPVHQATPSFHFDLKNILKTPTAFVYEVSTEVQMKANFSPCVFMWWVCQMAPGVELSCAPHWEHPEGRKQPWRDHWMQAVYYPRRTRGSWLRCSRDEFSLWFDLVDRPDEALIAPACSCGVHYSIPRMRLAQLHEDDLHRVLHKAIECSPEQNVLLFCDGGLTLPVALARSFPQKSFYLLDTITRLHSLTSNLLQVNKVTNCVIFDENEHKKLIQLIVADPFVNIAYLPWMNVLALDALVESMQLQSVRRLPQTCRLMGIEVNFENLWKIRAPIVNTVGLNMTEYDRFIQEAMGRCDSPVEPQPLWEYPGTAQSTPFLLSNNLVSGEKIHFRSNSKANGVALWVEFKYGCGLVLNYGPRTPPILGQPINWNRCVKQGVMLELAGSEDITFTI